jgi:hypothetical protein
MSFIATDGGAHPPDKLAKIAAEQIGALIELNEGSGTPEAIAARRQKPRLILDVADAIEQHYGEIIGHERAALGQQGTGRLAASGDPRAHAEHLAALNAALAAVLGATKGTVFEAHFQIEAVQAVVLGILGTWAATAIDIERDWVARGHTIGADHRASVNPDHNHNDPNVVAWKARRAGEG